MSAHPVERLSAYLDDALPERERAAVQAHLGACPDCSRQLAQLAALDAAARAEPVEPPEGYFDTLPRRVLRRLEAEARPARAAWALPFRLPVWSWAAAAALLVAVLAPLTWRASGPAVQVSRQEAESRPLATPAAAAPGFALQSVPAGPVAARQPRASAAAGIEQAEAPAPEGRLALAGKLADQKVNRRKEAEPARAPALPPQALSEAEADASARGEADRLKKVEPPPALAPAAPAPAALAAKTERADAAKLAPGAVPATGFAPRPPEESAEAKDDRGRGAVAVSAERSAGPKGKASGFDALAARRPPRTAGEARALREAWHAFLASQPEGAQADQARVRAIEAGLAVWRLGRDPADLEALQAEAEDYLARPDAAQAERVRALLAGL